MTKASNSATYFSRDYESPIGGITLCSNGTGLCGLWMSGQKYFGGTIPGEMTPDDGTAAAVLDDACEWLDEYFTGKRPEIRRLPLAPIGSDFRQAVWRVLTEIPYGETMTYGEIGRLVAQRQGKKTMASLAVGGAVGHNPISIIVPCHRVVGADGSLTGFAGGLDKKIWLLEHEGVDMSRLYRPATGTAL